MAPSPKKFTGTGTILIAALGDLRAKADMLDPMAMMKSVRAHMDAVFQDVERHGGVVVQAIGDNVRAFWGPDDPSHAQHAFDAAKAVLESFERLAKSGEVPFTVVVALGTGEMGGDFFGPTKQFQVVGKGVAVADRIFNHRRPNGSGVWMSRQTMDALESGDSIVPDGAAEREGAESLVVFAYRRSL